MEGIVDAIIPRIYYDALQFVIANGDQARARVFFATAHAKRVVLEGSDSPLAEAEGRKCTSSLIIDF